jgi:tetratricopeptide (TPR) repeat protein
MESPTALECFLESLGRLVSEGLDEVATMARGYIGQMASEILPSDHLWCQICRLIGLSDSDNLQYLFVQSWQCALDAFESELGPFHERTIHCRIDFLDRIARMTEISSTEGQLRKLFSDCEKLYGKFDERSQAIALKLGWSLYRQRRYAQAEAVAQDVFERARDEGSLILEIRGLDLLVRCQKCLSKRDLALRNMLKALGRTVQSFGRTDSLAVPPMLVEGWLCMWGRDDHADQFNADIIELLGLDDADQDLVGLR